MPQLDAEDAPVIDQKQHRQDHAGPRVAKNDDGLRSHAQGGEGPAEQADTAPEGTGQQDQENGPGLGAFGEGEGGLCGVFHGWDAPFS